MSIHPISRMLQLVLYRDPADHYDTKKKKIHSELYKPENRGSSLLKKLYPTCYLTAN